jgi:hypothetical protein
METYCREEVYIHVFLTSALALCGGRQLHAPAALYPGKIVPSNHWIGGSVGPRAGLDAVENKFILPAIERRPPTPYH